MVDANSIPNQILKTGFGISHLFFSFAFGKKRRKEADKTSWRLLQVGFHCRDVVANGGQDLIHLCQGRCLGGAGSKVAPCFGLLRVRTK